VDDGRARGELDGLLAARAAHRQDLADGEIDRLAWRGQRYGRLAAKAPDRAQEGDEDEKHANDSEDATGQGCLLDL